MIRKILKIFGITLGILLLLLFIAPFLFKGKIIALAKTEINKNINAKADFSDASISMFRRFPRVSLQLENLHVTGIGSFEGDTLISASEIDVALNLMSAIRGSNMKIYSVEVNNPRILAIVNKLGEANWDIVKPDTASVPTPESEPFNFELNNYSINNAYIDYRDSVGDMSALIKNLNHSGSGDFTADLFTLVTKTTAEEVDYVFGGIPYLADTKLALNADIAVNTTTSRYDFKTDEVSVNDLKIATEGFFQLVNDSTYNMDIQFNAPSTDFKNILSLIPAIYQKDFASVKTSGKAIFNGFVKGTMTGDQLPAYNVNLDVQNGFFQYPDLPAPMKNINLTLKVNNPDGVTDHTVVDIQKGHFELENEPFDFRMLLRNPVTSMFVDAAAKGRLDLAKLTRIVKLEEGTRLSGLLNADVNINGSIEAAEKQQYDQFNAAGTIRLADFLYADKDYPGGITLNSLLMTFNPRNVTISDLTGKYLSTAFSANGQINNLLAYALKDKPMNGVINVVADKVNLNEFMPATADSSASGEATTVFIVPANLDITVNAKADEVIYDKLSIRNLNGALKLADESVKLDNINGDALDGQIAISGSYSTRNNKTNPAIALQYDVKEVDVQKTFLAFNTVQKLMPIGKWLGGKLTSQMNVSGSMNESMMPDLASLTGDGNLFLIEGFLEKFAPLEKLAERLNIKELQDVTMREVRQRFEFTNGKVLVNPFTVKVKGIDMEIGGSHGIDQSLDYTINLKVPRSMMGTEGNQFVNNLITQASGAGIPLKVDEVVNLHVKMNGTITSPSLKVDLKETAQSLAEDMKDQIKDFAQSKVDSAKKAVTDTLQSVKKQVIESASDRLKKELFGRKDSLSNADTTNKTDPATRAKQAGKGLLENVNPFKKKAPAKDTAN